MSGTSKNTSVAHPCQHNPPAILGTKLDPDSLMKGNVKISSLRVILTTTFQSNFFRHVLNIISAFFLAYLLTFCLAVVLACRSAERTRPGSDVQQLGPESGGATAGPRIWWSGGEHCCPELAGPRGTLPSETDG